MEKVIYEVSMVCCDENFNGTRYIDFEYGISRAKAKKSVQKITKDLQNGKFNSQLENVPYVFIQAEPYTEEGEWLGGLEEDFATGYYKQEGDKWVEN